MKSSSLLLLSFLLSQILCAQIKDPKATEVWEPVPRVIKPGNATTPPSDAIVLLGNDTDEWTHHNGAAIKWTMENGILSAKKGSGDIYSKRTFGDCQLHVEWRSPAKVERNGQDRGNSGVYLQDRYEVQVLDNYENKTYPNGQAGAVYKQHIPLVNACRPPGEWQTYDIIYVAPKFNADGHKISSAYLTVLHNGILIQNHVEIKGTTEYIGLPKNKAHGKAPIKLQEHGNTVSYRNIWIREL